MRYARVGFSALILAAAMSAVAPLLAQVAEAQPVQTPAGQLERLAIVKAPVVIDGEELFAVRGISAFPAERRAAEIADRIRDVARGPRDVVPSLTLDEQPGVIWILADGERLVPVYDEDAAIESVDRVLLARAYAVRIGEAIAGYRSAREPTLLWRYSIRALVLAAALIAAAYFCRRVIRWVQARIQRKYRRHVKDVSIQSFQVLKAEQLWRLLYGLLNFIWAFTVVALAFLYLRHTLPLFPWTRGAANRLIEVVVEPVRSLALGLVGIIPNVIFLTILFLITRSLLKLLRLFFDSVARGTVRLRNFDHDWAMPTYKLVRVLIIACAIVVAYPYVPGSNTDAFKGVSLFVGVVFSLGSSSLIGNVISGYSMTYRRTFRVGDKVRIGQHVGEVQEIRLLATHLRTPWNEEVIFPNSSILAADVVNYSSMARQRGQNIILHATVRVGYETPWRQVEAMLIEAAVRTPGVLRDPPPSVYQRSLDAMRVVYEINVASASADGMIELYSALHRNILDVFNEYGVPLITPEYSVDPNESKVVPKERWYADPAHRPSGDA